ncbi:MAG: hypothetical protein FWF70_03910 [Bacteroidetes bacterium]|nr:hypothetical protein [Bacteroidota bacterium]MCL1968477.1 hypothetical protein [Bacteroidota bacterium]
MSETEHSTTGQTTITYNRIKSVSTFNDGQTAITYNRIKSVSTFNDGQTATTYKNRIETVP